MCFAIYACTFYLFFHLILFFHIPDYFLCPHNEYSLNMYLADHCQREGNRKPDKHKSTHNLDPCVFCSLLPVSRYIIGNICKVNIDGIMHDIMKFCSLNCLVCLFLFTWEMK